MMSIQVVWFKRDLRIHDHKPLFEAAQRGSVLPLYIIEPTLINAPDYSPRHYTFVQQSLAELRATLAKLGQPLVVRVGEAIDVLNTIHQQQPIAQLWAHEETGNLLTYQRDIAVRDWAASAEIPFTEFMQHGVVRRLKNRDIWANLWQDHMRQKLVETPKMLQPVAIDIGRIPTHDQLNFGRNDCTDPQIGGESLAIKQLNDFLLHGAPHYFGSLAYPRKAWQDSSRLSAHLAYGTLSLRRVVHGVRRRTEQIKKLNLTPSDKKNWLASLSAFESRLHWHCHFIQKLEDEPALEHHNAIRALDGVREPDFNEAYFEAWCAGQTGYPLIDAAMRALTATGWLNFRLRAMLVSFASYDLWLHWQRPALHLARLFVDYEPGIHYSQIQMQSGTTGINQMRVYDPTKQARERDADGTFIRQWVPELRPVSNLFIHEPWRMPPSAQGAIGCIIGQHYPSPIVDHKAAASAAYKRLDAARRQPEAQAQARQVLLKHGSRKPRPKRKKSAPKPSNQLQLNLGDVV